MNSFLKTVSASLALAFGGFAAEAATIEIASRDPAGVGFNDLTPVDPVGGNPGTTVGQQRRYVYRHVADIWEKALQSNVTIKVSAGWEALTCTASSAVLGSAGAWNIWHDFAGSVPGTWYPQALANKLSGVNLSDGTLDDGSGYGNVDIKTQFNVNLGKPGCLDGTGFYLGVDGKAGASVNFVETLLHELGHGLGFSVLTVQTSTGFRVLPDGSDYAAAGGLPSIWEGFMYDNTIGKTWLAMNNAERKASSINPLQLAWIGPNGTSGATQVLSAVPTIKIVTSVPGVAGLYDYGTALFGPPVAPSGPFGTLAVASTNLNGCAAFDAAASAAIAGKVAIIDRGSCSFVIKVKNAQDAGAAGVVIANNAAGSPPTLGGGDPAIAIPTVSVSQANGLMLRAAVAAAPKYGTRSRPGTVVALFGLDATRKAGADSTGRPLLYTPATLAPGSSVSHWDVTAFPNLLMEPAINADLTTTLVPPLDLTVPLLKDLGW